MNRIVNLTCVLVVISALLLLGHLSSAPNSAREAFSDFPVGHSRVINFDTQQDALEGMTKREQYDQLRDWLLLTTVSASGLSPEDINQSLFDLPAIRQSYLRQVANFEYGNTRSCFLGAGHVVALLPSGSAEERVANLAQIADQQRKNLGVMPETVSVFEYQIDADPDFENVSATLTRRETLRGADLFTDGYGYRQAEVRSLEDLRQLMERIDEITYARMSGDHLVLGGRRLPGRPYRGIRVEDVAAIWQSEAKIQAALSPQVKKIGEFNKRWAQRTYNTEAERVALVRQRDQEQAQLQDELNAYARQNQLKSGSAFSLDIAYDFDGLKKEFDNRIAPLLRKALPRVHDSTGFVHPGDGSQSDDAPSSHLIAEARKGLDEHDIGPLLNLLSKISPSDRPLVGLLTDYAGRRCPYRGVTPADTVARCLGWNYGFQSARYDGDLQGTEVGMVLFYTDLLAKLWAFDYAGSTPQREIRDFNSVLTTPVSTAYKKEMGELRRTRLWFGPQAKGFQVADGGSDILFAHTATRVYSASSSPLTPLKESEADARWASFIGWWDGHYPEIARFEPEYERLNEIMKWSLLIGWLNERGQGDKLAYLKTVEVDRSNWFPDWIKKRDLKFRSWERVGFYARGHMGTTTEAFPLLQSAKYTLFGQPQFLSGGVSLAGTWSFWGRAALSAETEVAPLLRSSTIDYGASRVAGEAVSFEGTAYRFTALAPGRAEMTAAARSGVSLRGTFGEMANLKFERVVEREPSGLRVNTRLDDVEMGSLRIEPTRNGFEVGWRSRDIDLGYSLARRLASSKEAGEALSADANVEAVVRLGEQGYLVKLRGADRWLQLSPEGKAAGSSQTWQARVGGLADDAPNYEITWKTSGQAGELFPAGDDIIIEPVKGFAGHYQLRTAPPGQPASSVQLEFQSGNVAVRGRLNPETGGVRFAADELPAALRDDPLKLQRLVAEARVTPGQTRYVVSEAAESNPLLQQFRTGNTRNLIDELMNAPAGFKARLGRELSEGIKNSDRLLDAGQYRDATRQLDELINVYGRRPELLLRRGAAKLSSRFPETAGPIRETLSEGAAKDPMLFYREVNERLRLASSLRENTTLVIEEGDVAIHCRLDPLAVKVEVPLTELQGSGRALVYVQDSPGLNNLDWSVSVQRTLNEAVSGDLATIVKLPRSPIAQLRPTRIYAPDSLTSYRAINQTGTNAGYRFPTLYYGPNYKGDKEQDESQEVDIYLIRARRP